MFCNRCGSQLSDSALFCNKCGARSPLKNPASKNTSFSAPNKNRGRKKTTFLLIALPIVAVILLTIFIILLNRPGIYGTWTDKNGLLTFTFQKNGSLRISGENNILGAELFQFTDDKDGNLSLRAEDIFGEKISLNIPYELSKDKLVLKVLGTRITLYRTNDKHTVREIVNNPDDAQNMMEDIVDGNFENFQPMSLYGTWADSNDVISFTFRENGTIRIGGLTDILGADLFTFVEIDNNTLQLKADTDNKLLNMISLQLNYEISEDVMTIEIAGQTFQLKRKE